MEHFDNDKEIKKANRSVNIFEELTYIFAFSSVGMATACAGIVIAKALGAGKGPLPLNSLLVTNLTGAVSMLFLASMSNILKNDAIDERNRLIENLKNKNKTITHYKNPNLINTQSKEHV